MVVKNISIACEAAVVSAQYASLQRVVELIIQWRVGFLLLPQGSL